MKKIILLIILLSFAGAAFAQRAPETKPDKDLTCEEAAIRIQDWEAKVNDLKNQLNNLSSEVQKASANLEAAKKAYKDCKDEIYRLIGATELDVEQFRQKLGVLEGKVRAMKNLSNDELAERRKEVEALENELNELRRNKISLIPEFFNRIIQLAKDIRDLYREPSVRKYTVGTWAKDRDCLWNIAGKIEIYGDPFLWPKIWQTNKSIIRNPDIIFPGQVLILPPKGPKTDEELKAERRYWRMKREAAQAAEQSATKGQ